jgi:type I restriction enzyme S subunit
MEEKVLDFFEVTTFGVESSKLLSDNIRFNADYFVSSDNILYREDLEFKPLSDSAQVTFPGIFKRIIVDSPEHGIPFITTSGMMEYTPEPEKFLSKELTNNLNIYRVEEDWILVSRSGTIGNTVFTSKILTPFAITEDALRVKPYNKDEVGFLYFFISSDYGKDAIVGKKGGAVIDHIYEEDLMRLQIPVVSHDIILALQKKYLSVKELREKANELLHDANELLYAFNNLPPLNSQDCVSFDRNNEIASRILDSNKIDNSFRFDARFYNPLADLAIRNILSHAPAYEPLEKLTKDIVMGKRFKRNYVESQFGTPFIGSKNILQIKPELKHLSNSETDFIGDLLLKRDYILIACSGSLGGTFGKVGFVYKNYEGYAASQHILRVIPDESKVDSGYLYCFLNSDYGYTEIIRYRYGSLIDEIDNENMNEVIIPLCSTQEQKIIGDKVRLAFDKRAEAIRTEDEAQEILKQYLTK